MSLTLTTFYIHRYFAWYLTEIRLANQRGYMDVNKLAERLLVPVMNLVYNTNDFERLEYREQNFPGVDIGSKSLGLAFQVTAETGAQKIRDTVDAVLHYQIYKTYPVCKLLFLNEKYRSSLTQEQIGDQIAQSCSNLPLPCLYVFDIKEDCWNIDRLLAVIEELLDAEGLAKLVGFLRQEFGELGDLLRVTSANAYRLPLTIPETHHVGDDFFSLFARENPALTLAFKQFSADQLDEHTGWLARHLFKEGVELLRMLTAAYYEAMVAFRNSVTTTEQDETYRLAKHFFRSGHFAAQLLNNGLRDNVIDPLELISELAADGYTDHLSASNFAAFREFFKDAMTVQDRLRLFAPPEMGVPLVFSTSADLQAAVRLIKEDQTFYTKAANAFSASAADEANFIEKTTWSKEREAIYLDDVYIPRTPENEIKEKIDSAVGSHHLLFVSGDAGNGKTSLLWHLYHTYRKETRFYPLFLKSIQLLTYDFSKLLGLLHQQLGVQPLIFLDTIDLLLHGQGDREKLIEFLYLLEPAGAVCVASSRPQELSSLASLKSHFGHRYSLVRLGNYEEEELELAIRKYAAVYYEQVPIRELDNTIRLIQEQAVNNRSLKVVYLNPLTNRMLFTLYAPVSLPPAINTFRLYEQYWADKVTRDARAGSDGIPDQSNARRDLSLQACTIAMILLAEGTVSAPTSKLVAYAHQRPLTQMDIHLLIDRGILKPAGNQHVEFFHQTFFEHACAKAFIRFTGPEAIRLPHSRVFMNDGQLADSALFVSPILEHTLLLAEPTRLSHESRQTVATLISSQAPDAIRIGTYVYALYSQEYPELTTAIDRQLTTFRAEDSIYVKRFLITAPNLDDNRLPYLFPLLEKVWVRDIWNERYNLIELLDYLVLKEPIRTRDFIEKNAVLTDSIQLYQSKTKREHQPTFKDLVRIFFQLLRHDRLYARDRLLLTAAINDMPISRLILNYGEKIPELSGDSTFWRDFLTILYKAELQKHGSNRETAVEMLQLLSDILLQCWKIEGCPVLVLLAELELDANSTVRNTTLMALGKMSGGFTPEIAQSVFDYFKTKVAKDDIFDWCRNLVAFTRRQSDQPNLLEDLFLADIRLYLETGESGDPQSRDTVILRGYRQTFNKVDGSTPSYLFAAFEDLYLNQKYLAAYPTLARLLLFAFINGYSDTSAFTGSIPTTFFANHPLVSQKLTSTISTECTFTAPLFRFFLELCLIGGRTKVITAQLERICTGLFVNHRDVPAYLFPFRERLFQLAYSAIQTNDITQRAEGTHLLLILVKTGLAENLSFSELQALFADDRRDNVLSWLIELYGYCVATDEHEARSILNHCRTFFDHSVPKLDGKARCSWLFFIHYCHYDLSDLQDEILQTYFDSRETDQTSQRIKIINRIIMKYAAMRHPLAFELLNGLLRSELLQSYSTTKQNETNHELHNGCIHISMYLPVEYLSKLAMLLQTTTCSYGRLVLDGIAFDKFKLEMLSSQLDEIKASATALPCNKHQLANILQYKLKPLMSDHWKALLEFI